MDFTFPVSPLYLYFVNICLQNPPRKTLHAIFSIIMLYNYYNFVYVENFFSKNPKNGHFFKMCGFFEEFL